ncbi:MAG: (Fe-S)-binding protein, partial [bacterium]|nr:(Fe-S)-binding protein [bacterium]
MTDKTKNIDEIAKTCSTCGNCLHSCPVYNAQWVEPNSPRGKINLIKALRDGRLEMDDSTKKLLYHCVLCGSCQNICTKGVEFVDMMVEVRNEVAQGRKIPFVKKAILQLYQSLLFKKFTWVVDILYRTPLKNHLLLPKRKRANLKKIQAEGKPGESYDIMLYPGCVMTHFYPGLLEKTYNYLKKKGYSVVVPKN